MGIVVLAGTTSTVGQELDNQAKISHATTDKSFGQFEHSGAGNLAGRASLPTGGSGEWHCRVFSELIGRKLSTDARRDL